MVLNIPKTMATPWSIAGGFIFSFPIAAADIHRSTYDSRSITRSALHSTQDSETIGTSGFELRVSAGVFFIFQTVSRT